MAKRYIGKFVQFQRKSLDKDRLRGYVLDYTLELTLLAKLDTDFWQTNGFMLLRNDDVSDYRVPAPSDYFYQAARLMKCKIPKTPKMDLTSWRTALLDAGEQYPLLNIHREAIRPDSCNVGRLTEITEKTISLHEIDSKAKWEKVSRFRLSDITRVEFHGNYEKALWLAAEENRMRRGRK